MNVMDALSDDAKKAAYGAMDQQVQKKMKALVIRISIYITLITLAITLVTTLAITIAGLPTLLASALGVLVTVIGFILLRVAIILGLRARKVYLNKQSGKFKETINKIYIIFLVISIILNIGGSTLLGMALGGDDYWETQAALMTELIGGEEVDETEEEYDWGFGSGEQTPEQLEPGFTYVSEVDKILAIARREAKYYSDNNIRGGDKYWRWLDGEGHGCSQHTYNGVTGWEWCATFMTYLLYESGIATRDASDATNYTFGNFMDSCWNVRGCTAWFEWCIAAGWEPKLVEDGYEPKPGDICLISYYKNNFDINDTTYNHIAIVDHMEGNKIVLIEGNINGNHRVYLSTGNTKCFSSKVTENKRHKLTGAGLGGHMVFFSPPYKTEKVYTNGVIGNFDINMYQKQASGYYSEDTVLQMVYDFCILELGLSSAAAVGVATNVSLESASYDQLEVANGGKAYVSKDTSAKYFSVPNNYGNGNYKNIPDIDTYMRTIVDSLWYVANDPDDSDGFVKYGGGYGICQWSFGRRVNLLKFAEDNGYGSAMGPDGLAAQIAFIDHELSNSYRSTYDLIKGVTNDAAGAFDAAAYFCHNYEKPGGHIGTLAYNLCPKCSSRGRHARDVVWPKLGNTNPSINYSGTVPTGSTDIGNAIIIGDSNTVAMSSYGDLANAKGVLAIQNVGVNSWDNYVLTGVGQTTIPGKSLKAGIDSCSSFDLSHVLIMLGTNDYAYDADTFKANYTELLEYIKSKNATARITMCTILPVNDAKTSTIKSADVDKINTAIKELANSYTGLSIFLCDVNSYMSTSHLSDDGMHLTSGGSERLANYISQSCR